MIELDKMKNLRLKINEIEDEKFVELGTEDVKIQLTQLQKFYRRYSEDWKKRNKEYQEKHYFDVMGDI